MRVRLLPDFFTPEFDKAGFGWGTDPDGIQIGGCDLEASLESSRHVTRIGACEPIKTVEEKRLRNGAS